MIQFPPITVEVDGHQHLEVVRNKFRTLQVKCEEAKAKAMARAEAIKREIDQILAPIEKEKVALWEECFEAAKKDGLVPEGVLTQDDCVMEFSKGNCLRFTISQVDADEADFGAFMQMLMKGGTPGVARPKPTLAPVIPFGKRDDTTVH